MAYPGARPLSYAAHQRSSWSAQNGRSSTRHSRLGSAATYYPGQDDYMMPELSIVHPSPQRLMPEVPAQIADNLEHLSLDDRNRVNGGGPGGMYSGAPHARGNFSGQPPHEHGGYHDRTASHASYTSAITMADEYTPRFVEEPSYSPFPRLINPGPNIPPTDDEKMDQIEGARMAVLSSNDPEMQLIWAQDALNYVEVALNYHMRISEPAAPRPPTPAVEHQVKTDAVNVVSFLADQHHPRAEFMRGGWLEFGKFGFRTDKKEAFRCYARAAEKGYARAEYRMGMQFENSNEPMKAIKHYNQGAALGDSASNYRLGMMTLLGQHGQRQDYARGVSLIRQAAETADENAPQGAYVYGMLLARELPGIEVPADYLPYDVIMAKEMIEKAAFLGFARAQLKMGTAYELCQLNCEFDPALSLHYNALAARQGEPEADMAISKWFLCGHEGVFDKNEELAFIYAKRAASSGLGTAEFALGYFYEIGMFVPVDLQEAQRWYAKAAAHGNKDASGRIDGISRSKTLSKRDHESMAVSKIRARHGSQRQKVNPLTARGGARQSVVPAVVQEEDMPADPMGPPAGTIPPAGTYNYNQAPHPMHRNNTMPPGEPNGPGGYGPPHRVGTAPYPEQRPGSSQGLVAVHGPHRPSSPGYGAPPQPHHRSSSYNVANRPISHAATGGLGPGMIPPAGTYPGQGPRPSSSMSNLSAASAPGPRPRQASYNNRPGPGPGPGYPAPGMHSPPLEPGYPGSGYGPGPQGPPALAPIKPVQSMLDIGFEAPDPRPQPPKSPAPSAHSTMSKNSGRGPQPQGSPTQRPQQGAPHSPSPVQSPRPPPTPTPQVARAPSKGPKTFEEMGVPQQKQEQDCVIM